MATIPTSNPIPSESPRDLKFNAGKIDEFVNSPSNTYIDRFGVTRFTITGIEYTAAEAISQLGYIPVDSFEDGANLTLPNQILRYEATGEYYRWDGSFPKTVAPASTPATSGGIGQGAWLSVGDGALRSLLASNNGSTAIGFKGTLANEVPVTLNAFLKPTFLLSRWGAVGDGVTDDSVAIQRAIDAMPDVGTLYFDKPAYKLNNVTISKGVSLLGSDFSQSGVHLINNHPTNPTFKATDINNIKIDGFYFDSSVTRTSSTKGYLDFTTSHRVTVQNCFFWEYFLAVSFNGGTEINFDTCEGFTTKNGTGSGFAWFGKDNYTGSINIVNCYLKVDDSATSLPEFGIRFGYVDVAYIDGSTTIIRHGNDVEVVPNGAGQFAHLIKIVGGILDTAKSGIFVQPINGADAEVELVGCYSAAMASAAWIFDGTNGKVVASISGGQVFNCGISAVEVIGANATVNISNLRFSNNQIGLHVTNNGTCYADACLFGNFDNAAGNQNAYAMDATAKGCLRGSIFRNNINFGNNASSNFRITDLWFDFAPVVSATSGALGPVTVSNCRYMVTGTPVNGYKVSYYATFTITNNNTGSGAVTVSLPIASRTRVFGFGNNESTGSMLQVRGGNLATAIGIYKYDNSYPAATGNIINFMAEYEII